MNLCKVSSGEFDTKQTIKNKKPPITGWLTSIKKALTKEDSLQQKH